MTGKERKPQTPSKNTTIVRQNTDWQDGVWPGSVMRSVTPKYERLPTQPKPSETENPAGPVGGP